tara:strand:- start:51 stop:1241 length:1191 start_codon:yes stop_codon:yes gene_type:complete
MKHYNLIKYNNEVNNIIFDLNNNLDKLKEYHLKYKKFNDYILINYYKDKINTENIETLGLFRSCLFKNNKLICFSPPKSINYNIFKGSSDIKQCVVEEFIDGTLINLYYDAEDNSNGTGWKTSTKGYIGLRNKYFKNYNNDKSFNTMFIETCLDINFDFGSLPKDYCYSFVLQHKENRIVTKFYNNNLYLVKCYKINGLNIEMINLDYFKNLECFNVLKYPEIYKFENYDDLENQLLTLDYNNKGYYIVDYNNYKHSKIRNPNYEYVKNIRGNDVKLQYTYLRLLKENKLDLYLKYYPEHQSMFDFYQKDYLYYIRNLYNNYVEVYITKKLQFRTLNKEYKKNLYNIHGIYLTNKSQNLNKSITFEDVNKYFENLDCSQQMYYLNNKYYNNVNIVN